MHPDKVAAGSEAEREKAEDRFKEIQEAYNILSDETSRRLYDSTDAFDDTLPVDCDPADFFKVLIITWTWVRILSSGLWSSIQEVQPLVGGQGGC